MTPTQRTDELRAEIRRHDRLYYAEQAPVITDSQYDTLLAELADLEDQHPEVHDPNSPTQRVAGEPAADFPRVEHPTAMLSLANAFNSAEFRAWHRRVSNLLDGEPFRMVAELKIDGLALRLDYVNGELVLGTTRGNGRVGEDVTHNVRTVRSLPLRLTGQPPDRMEVRGEIYLPKDQFERVNRERAESGDYQYANPRNAGAGTIRQFNSQVASDRRLEAWIYSLNNFGSRQAPESHWQALQILRDYGCPVNPLTRLCDSIEEVETFYPEVLAQRYDWNYDADGIVVKVDDLGWQETLGAAGREPRWAIAWKFPAERAVIRLRDIEISLGRFGRLTPVAVLEPVTVGGVTVRNATLHNEEDIRRKDIRAGATVIIERAGDVIPQVVGPYDPEETAKLTEFKMPSHCPACAAEVVSEPEDASHWCPNQDCGSRLLQHFGHFVSKRAMDIEGLGPHWVKPWLNRGS